MKTAVIYARYSSDAQTEQSIEGQLRVCQEYAKNNNIFIVDTYIDRAMTGTNDNRAAFQKMLKDSSNGQFSLVLVYKLDRFSRNKFESVVHKKTLKDNGVTVLSAMENISDTPEGRMLESILESFNQYFSEELTQKVNRGLRESWMKGNATGGQGYFGYRVVDKKYVIEEREAEIVQEIFERYAKGWVARSIVDDLNNRGICRHNGMKFGLNYLYAILHNIRYTGIVYHKGECYSNIFPRIISDELWNAVCSINEDNKQSGSNKKEIYEYILTGKLVCGTCKHRMSGVSGTSHTKDIHYYYVCKSRKRQKSDCCKKPISKSFLEDLVINTTLAILQNKTNVHNIAQKLFELHQKESADNTTINLLKAKRNEAIKASQNIMRAIEQGIITEQTKTRLVELECQITNYDVEIDKEKQRTHTHLTMDEIEQFLTSIIITDTQDLTIRKIIVNTFIREIILYDNELVITYYFDDNPKSNKITPANIEQTEQQLESNTPTAITLDLGSTTLLGGAPKP